MSSLMQFNGKITHNRVHLMFTHSPQTEVRYGPEPGQAYKGSPRDTDGIYAGGKFYARIWTAPRKPLGMCGCWVIFRYNGEKHVPDLSIPISVDKLPRDAVPMPIDDCIKYWNS